MKTDEDQINELEGQVERMQHEVDQYRRATEDCLQELGWCSGYFAGIRQRGIGCALAFNVGQIRRALWRGELVVMPARED
jgi:hypothetical protein